MSRFLNSKFSELIPYVPGEQPQHREYIKLNTNESPYPPSPKAMQAISQQELEKLQRYPDPQCQGLINAISKTYAVERDNIALGNGSDEILAFAVQAFCGNGTKLCFPDISYGFYRVFADLYGVEKHIIPLMENFSIDPKDYYNVNGTIFIANPNAPTGLALDLSQIEDILKHNTNNIVVIDEAYVDFGAKSALELIKYYDNLLVIRTFSKAYNLAGARLGYAFAQREIIEDLNKIKFSFNPYNINRLSLLLGESSILDREYFKNCIDSIISTREYTIEELRKREFSCLESKANFIFAKHKKISGEELYNRLKAQGILTRYFNSDRICNYIRISIGSLKDMQSLINVIDTGGVL